MRKEKRRKEIETMKKEKFQEIVDKLDKVAINLATALLQNTGNAFIEETKEAYLEVINLLTAEIDKAYNFATLMVYLERRVEYWLNSHKQLEQELKNCRDLKTILEVEE